MRETSSGKDRLAVLRGLRAHMESCVLGQEEAIGTLCDALLAGEMGHTPPGRPRSMALILGPTGTGKTKAVLSASAHLFGTEAVARINCAEFSSAERVPLLLGSRAGDSGLLGAAISRMREAGGRIVLLDEIEKAHPSVADHLLGIEEAAVTLANGETLDLSGLHVIATSNVGSAGVTEMEGVAGASVRRFVEQEAAAQFRPEVLARFTAVLVFGHLGLEVQVRICEQMLEQEVAFQCRVLSRSFGHAHRIHVGEGVGSRLVAEGWQRRLGARPMRNVVERRVRGALVESQLAGSLGPGIPDSVLTLAAAGVRLAIPRAGVTL